MVGRLERSAADTSVAEDASTVLMAGRTDSNSRLRLARCPVGKEKASAAPGSAVPVAAGWAPIARDSPAGRLGLAAPYEVRFRPKREVVADNWDIPAAAPARECQ